MRVAALTPPAVEPVTAEELVAFARIDPDAATEEQPLIAAFITAAREAAESYTRRSFITRTLRASLDTIGIRDDWTPGHFDLPWNSFDSSLPASLALPRGPVQQIISVTTYDTDGVGAEYAGTRYGLYGDRLVLDGGESWPSDLRAATAAEVVYVAGYGDAPADVPRAIRMAILIHAGMLYDTRGQCEGDVPPSCMPMLAPYRIMDV